MPAPIAPTRTIEFIIGDLAYSAGYNCDDTIRRKQAYYADLVSALRRRGWSVRTTSGPACAGPDITSLDATGGTTDPAVPTAPTPNGDYIFVFFLGTSGEIYQSLLNSLRAFDINRDLIKPLAQELHILSVNKTCEMLNTRRALDKSARHPNSTRPP